MACVDVDYRARGAVAACVLFHAFGDAAPASEHTTAIADVEPYEPGAFYKRELPCLLEVLRLSTAPLDVVLVDGHVWLGPARPGLGAHLHRELGGGVAVIGVAKQPFQGNTLAREVLRGSSKQPLY